VNHALLVTHVHLVCSVRLENMYAIVLEILANHAMQPDLANEVYSVLMARSIALTSAQIGEALVNSSLSTNHLPLFG
jgi:hypothetical protein